METSADESQGGCAGSHCASRTGASCVDFGAADTEPACSSAGSSCKSPTPTGSSKIGTEPASSRSSSSCKSPDPDGTSSCCCCKWR